MVRPRLSLTPYGRVFVAVVGALLFGSVNYGNNLGLILSFLVAGSAVVSLVLTRRNLQGLVLAAGKAEPAFAGEPVSFSLLLVPGGRGAALVRAFFAEDKTTSRTVSQAAGACLELPPGGVTVAATAPPAQRGRYRPGPLILESEHPFGLARARLLVDHGLEAVVYPRPLEGPTPPPLDRGEEGAVSRREGAEDFHGLREHRPGDGARRIAWKASARGAGLYTKVFRDQAGEGALLDYAALAGSVELRLSRLAGMLLAAEAAGRRSLLRLPGREVGPGLGASHRRACLTALALFGVPEDRFDAPLPGGADQAVRP